MKLKTEYKTGEKRMTKDQREFYQALLELEKSEPVKNGDHFDDCIVCGMGLEYHTHDGGFAYGDVDLGTCHECGATYTEGWINPPNPWSDVNVPLLKLDYLKQVADEANKVRAAEEVIRQSGIIHS